MLAFQLSSGAQMFAEQGSRDDLLSIRGFQTGVRAPRASDILAWDSVEPSLATMQGALSYSADNNAISYSITGVDEVRLCCLIKETAPEITLGNIVILASFGFEEPRGLVYAGDPDALIKLAATPSSAGYRYPFYFTLRLPGLFDRFDFSNLTRVVPEWQEHDNETTLPPAGRDDHTQYLLQSHTSYAGVHPVFNVGNRYFGVPVLTCLDGKQLPDRWVLSGGESGDNYGRT